MNTALRSGLQLALGLLLGSLLSVAELAFACLAVPALLLVQALPRPRRVVLKPVRTAGRLLAECERARLEAFLGIRCSSSYEDDRALCYLATRWPLGLLAAVVMACALIGAGYGLGIVFAWVLSDVKDPVAVILSSVGGSVLFFMAAQGLVGVGAMERRLARHFLGPSSKEELRRRIDELFTSRAEVVEAVHDERRRIERDLHDGVQQRLVALGVLLARTRRSGGAEGTEDLLEQAYQESRLALTDLREVAWRVYPTALDAEGLKAALETVVERAGVPVKLLYLVQEEPRPTASAVAYFVVAEAVTNAVKHARATQVEVMIEENGGMLRVRIEDDGRGEADSTGGGLTGLARRTAALDGRLDVHSPAGGPTVITAELPCG